MATYDRRRHHRHKRHHFAPSWLKWGEIKIYLGIAFICLILAGILSFVVKKGTDVVDRVNTITDQLPEREVLDKLLSTQEGESLVTDQAGKAITGNADKLNEDDLAKAKEIYKDKLSEDEIKKLKNAYERFTGK